MVKSLDVIRQEIRSGLDRRDFAMLYLWIAFKARGGCADTAALKGFIRTGRGISDQDLEVLAVVVDELCPGR